MQLLKRQTLWRCSRRCFFDYDSKYNISLAALQHFGLPAQPFEQFYEVVSNPPHSLSKTEPCGITSKFNVLEGKEEEFLKIMKANIAGTRTEEGMLMYDLNRDIWQSNVFWLIEKWNSLQDLEDHVKMEHYTECWRAFHSSQCLHPTHGCLLSLYHTGLEINSEATVDDKIKYDPSESKLNSLTAMQHYGVGGPFPAVFPHFYKFIAEPTEMMSSNEPCGLTAKFNIIDGKQEEFLEIMRMNIEGTLKEEGMILYDLNRDIFDPTVFWLIEKWKTIADLSAHTQTPHYAKTAAIASCLTGPETGCLVSLYKTGF